MRNQQSGVHPWRRACLQSVGLLALALTLAVVVNSLRSDGLPWIGDWGHSSSEADVAAGGLGISLEEAQLLYLTEQAVFLDARSPDAYRAGHIEKALNLPWVHFAERSVHVLEQIPKEKPIITYCDEGCTLSEHLAAALIAQGYTQVRVLENGWSEWVRSGLPVAMEP